MFSFLKKYWKFFIIPFLIIVILIGCNTIKIINNNKQSYNTISSGHDLRQFTYYGTYSVPVDNE